MSFLNLGLPIGIEKFRPFRSSIKVHLVAITPFHIPIEDFLVIPHSVTARSLKGLITPFTQIRIPTPLWDPNLVLNHHMKQRFEPLAMCSLLHLSMKTAFLVAITSVQGIGEMGALMGDPPFNLFSKDKISLWPHPKFWSHMSSVHLLVFFSPKSHQPTHESAFHTLYVKGALAFYLGRTRSFRKTPRFFVFIADRFKGAPIST